MTNPQAVDARLGIGRQLGGGRLVLSGVAQVPTSHGEVQLRAYREAATGLEHVAVVAGQADGVTDPLVRVHSECLTGEAFASLKCDCRDQLDKALALIQGAAFGVVVYLRQEGRGIGLGHKLRAYALQDEGLDTVDANLALGFPEDARDYGIAALMLKDLAISRLRLLTNNPAKIEGLKAEGLEISERIAHVCCGTPHASAYLQTKAERMGHRYDETPLTQDAELPQRSA